MSWRRWAERGVFVASVLALLATSPPPRWHVAGTVTGPTKTSATTKALSLSIESSHETVIRASSIPSSYDPGKGTPCLEPFVAGTKRTCLFPPGATLDTVHMNGPCGGGCSGPCTPPPGAHATVDVTEVDVSIDGDTKTMATSLPSHGKGFIASRFEVKASGASFIQAHMTVTARSTGKSLYDENQACNLDAASKHARCTFTVFDSALAGEHDVDVTVDATGYDACPTAGCAPPKTFHVDSLGVVP